MNATLTAGFGWLLRASAQAAILTLLVLAAQFCLRKGLAARWRHWLWLLVLARLALPFSPPSPLSLFNYLRVDPAIQPAPAPRLEPVREWSPRPPSLPPPSIETEPSEEIVRPRDADRAPAMALPPTAPAPVASRKDAWLRLLALVWAGGVAALAARIAAQNFLLCRRLRRARPVDDARALDALRQCKALMGVASDVRLVETGAVKGPALYGLFRPRLLLPPGLAASFNAAEFRHVLLHELAHVRRQDMVLQWLVVLFQTAHWFNPVLRFGFRRMAADRELACDELALSKAGEPERRAYGETILKLLAACSRPAALPGVVGILEDKSEMFRRIARIARFQVRPRWSLAGAAAAAVLALATLTGAQTGTTPKGLSRDLSGAPQTNNVSGAMAGPAHDGFEVTPSSTNGVIEWYPERQRWTGTNGVIVRFDGVVLTADTVAVHEDTGEVKADGHVRLQKGDRILWRGEHLRVIWKGEHLQGNFDSGAVIHEPAQELAKFFSPSSDGSTSPGPARAGAPAGGQGTNVSVPSSGLSQGVEEVRRRVERFGVAEPVGASAAQGAGARAETTNGTTVLAALLQAAHGWGKLNAVSSKGLLEWSPQRLVGTNGVIVRFDGVVLTADTLEMNRDTGEVNADGHVRLEKGARTWECEHLHYNSYSGRLKLEPAQDIRELFSPSSESSTSPAPARAGEHDLVVVLKGTLKEGPDGIDWQSWSPAAVSEARAQGHPVLVDFTANWCLTCQLNKRRALEVPSVRQKLREIHATALLGDYTLFPTNITAELNRYDRAAVPLVLVYPKDPQAPAIVLPEALFSPGIVLAALDRASR